MADRRSLGIMGFLLGGVTFAVMLTAVVVTKHHLDSRLSVEAGLPVVAAMAQATIR